MKAKNIALLLIPLNIILFYFVYNSIKSEIDFNKDDKRSETRLEVVNVCEAKFLR